jgi:two-component system OmpR family response regulator
VVTLNGKAVTLTSHEYRTLSYLMHQQGRVVSRHRAHRAHLRPELRARLEHGGSVRGAPARKLGPSIIETVRGLGYRMGA